MKNEVTASTVKAERLQTRASTNSDYIDELAERMGAGDIFPPIVIFTDGKDSWLADGIHRLDAAVKAKKKIGVDTRKGSRADAVEFACGANASHGMRRTNADKRRSVTLALDAFPERSSRTLADLCGVGHHMVEELRQLGAAPTTATRQASGASPPKRTGKDGKQQSAAKNKPATPAETSDRPEPAEAEPAAREWGDGSSLDDVQADLKELARRCRELSKFARMILQCEENDPTRPYCSNYSLLTVSHPLLHVARCVANDLPVGGTPKKPILFHEEKAANLAK